MPTSSFTKFYDFADQLGKAKHDFSTHNFKLALSNSAPALTNTLLSDITQIAATGGYTAGGYALSGVTWAETTGTGKLSITDHVVTATGGAIGPFRYLVLYNDSATSPLDALIGWYDYGSAVTLNDGETLTLDFDGVNGVLTIA